MTDEHPAVSGAVVYTPELVAQILGVSKRVVLAELRAGRLVGFKVGSAWRVRPLMLSDYMRKGERR